MPRGLRAAFNLTGDSPLRDRSLRDSLEHFDERLDKYLLTSDAGQYMPLPRVGDSEGLPDGNRHIFKLLDPDRSVFMVLDAKFDFAPVRAEVARVLIEAGRMSRSGDRLSPAQ